MRKINICFLILLLLTGCYGVEEQELTPLAELTIGNPTDVINADLGIELVFDAQVSSANDQTVKYEWAYGTPNPSSSAVYPIKGDLKVISTDPNIRYTFTRVGNYIMRLKIDNGESIVFKFYTLNVNSGLDEGILILNTDDQDHSLLTFIKTRTPEEEEEGAQEIYEDIVGMINPGIEITKGVDLYIANKNSEGNYPDLVVSSADDKGSIISMDPRNFELKKVLKVEELYPGVKCLNFAGFSSSASGRYTMMNGTDGAIYRYDLLTNDVALRTDSRNLGVEKAYYGTFDDDHYHFFYKESVIYAPSYAKIDSTSVANGSSLTDYKIVNMVFRRRGSRELWVITRRKSDNNIVLHKMSSTFTQYAKRLDYAETEPMAMDENSEMITTRRSAQMYYNYDNKVYRWDYASRIPTIISKPAITPPAGEEITTLGRSYDENYLYVGTYNPARSGKKGSLYIYDFATQNLVKSYEGIVDKPVKILYKYRM